MEKAIAKYEFANIKPNLFLHVCCAPCASSVIERLKQHFNITAYFFNPNINGEGEYVLRANELLRLCEYFGVKCIVEDFDNKAFYEAVKGLENCVEGGNRCKECFKLRFNKTATEAKNRGFNLFATTLTVSPLKSAEIINEICFEIASKFDIKYLPSDFKKRGGYQRSIELSKELNLYRQNYCGCEFSKR